MARKSKQERLQEEYLALLAAPFEGPAALEGLEIRQGAPREEDFLEFREEHFAAALEFEQHYRGRTELRLLGYLYFSPENTHFLKRYAHAVPEGDHPRETFLLERWLPVYLMYSSEAGGDHLVHFLGLEHKWLVLMYGNDGETMAWPLESEAQALLFWQTLPKEAFLNALEFYETWVNTC